LAAHLQEVAALGDGEVELERRLGGRVRLGRAGRGLGDLDLTQLGPHGRHHQEGDHHREHVDEGDELDVEIDLPLTPPAAGNANACHNAFSLPWLRANGATGEGNDQSARFSSGVEGIFILSWLATTRFRSPTEVSLMSSIMACVRPWRMA